MSRPHPVLSASGYNVTRLDRRQIEDLAADLNDEERHILLYQGTEPPFCGTLVDTSQEGVYVCRLCDLPLFQSSAKFHSGTGWPSFFQPFDPDHIEERFDESYGMRRTEIRCARCGGHLGHVFPDGPPPTGNRYCVNSPSMQFVPEGEDLPNKV
jgi:peptide-methionine (R)-S-oxide reductase